MTRPIPNSERVSAFAVVQSGNLISELCGSYANAYISKFLEPKIAEINCGPNLSPEFKLSDPFVCLQFLVRRYVFHHRGKQKELLVRSAENYLLTTSDPISSSRLNAPKTSIPTEPSKTLEVGDAALIENLRALCLDLWDKERLSVLNWVKLGAERRTLKRVFNDLIELPGLGPKSAALILRDFVFLTGSEDVLSRNDRPLVQPIDRWRKRFACAQFGRENLTDWEASLQLADLASVQNVSGIRLNFGIEYLAILCSRTKNPQEQFGEFTSQLGQESSSSFNQPV